MSRTLTPRSTLESLRKEAKRWLKGLRNGDARARARFTAATGAAPDDPGLRDVQFALAREHGLPGWIALKQALDDLALAQQPHAERVDRLLRGMAWGADRTVATRILARWPAIATDNLLTAAATGQLAAAQRFLAADPSAATRSADPLGWTPLQYLVHSRLPGSDVDSVEIARALLDAGADPNAAWDDGWGNVFTLVTGAIGAGENMLPPHPQARALVDLLLARGADPFDKQALYNTSLAGDDTAWLDVLWSASEQRGRTEAWHARPEPGRGIGGKIPVNALDYLLGNAVTRNHLQRAAWLLARGADANARHAYAAHPLCEEALLHGFDAMAELLVHHGARRVALSGDAAYRAACMRLDRAVAAAMVAKHPRLLTDAEPMLSAARQGRVDVMALLVDLGVGVDVADGSGMRALQVAVAAGQVALVEWLLDRGAAVDTPTTQYDGAMGFAAHFGHREIGALLAPRSRDVHNMTQLGLHERLAELFAEDAGLANARHFLAGVTPLFMLPADDDEAADIALFLLAHGAEPTIRNRDGQTPEDALRAASRDEVADVLRAAGDDDSD